MAGYKILGKAEEVLPSNQYKIMKDKSPEEDMAYLENLPQPEGFFAKLPRNILIGLSNLGHRSLNFPHELAEGLEDRIRELGESFNGHGNLDGTPIKGEFRVSNLIPTQEGHDYASLLGQEGEGTLMDRLLQKGIEYLPEITGGRTLLRAGLRKFPVTMRGASRQLREAKKIIKKNELNTPLSTELLGESMDFLPNTNATMAMIERAGLGEYEPAFSLQSQVGHHARSLRKSPLASERLRAPQAQELKQRALAEIEEALRTYGTSESIKAADFMRGGINDYRKYMKFKEEVMPIVKKIGIPGSVLGVLGLGYNKGKKLIKR